MHTMYTSGFSMHCVGIGGAGHAVLEVARELVVVVGVSRLMLTPLGAANTAGRSAKRDETFIVEIFKS